MIGEIEDAMIARITVAQGADGVLGYAVPTIGSYGGELDQDLAALARGRYPAIWITYAGEDTPREVAGGRECPAVFAVLVAARSSRNETVRRRGDGGVVGAYQIQRDVRALLIDQQLGLDIQPIKLRRVRPIFNGLTGDQRLAVYALDLEISYPQPAVASGGGGGGGDLGLGDFLTFHAEWDLPPHGGNNERPYPVDHLERDHLEDLS